MSRFNTPAATVSRTVNLAGGEAFVQAPKMEFASILLTSMLGDGAYRSGDGTMARIAELVDAVGPEFAAKAAVFARNEYGMRSVSHVVAGEVAARAKGVTWTRPFFRSVVRRPDDMTEIVAYFIGKHGRRPLPNSLRDGLAQAFSKFDSYSLAKYREEGKAVSLVDVVNLVHPKPTERNAEALKALVDGSLRSTDTWESMLSAAGGDEEAVTGAWADLIREKKIGYFALLRNLRNIMEQAPDVLDEALALLVDEESIRRSLVMPFRYMTAANEIAKLPDSRKVLESIDKAVGIAVQNAPRFDGRTLVVVDASSSMTFTLSGKTKTSVADVAALFAAVIYSRNDADLMLFHTQAGYAQVMPGSVLGLTQGIRQAMQGGGTDFKPIFQVASKPYDRIVILSDMQGWVGYNAPTTAFAEYVARVGKRPKVYSFDLAGMGSLQFPEQDVFCLAGFSDKVFDLMVTLEGDREGLVKRIESIEF